MCLHMFTFRIGIEIIFEQACQDPHGNITLVFFFMTLIHAFSHHLPVGNLPGDPIPWTMVLHRAKDSIPQKILNYDLIQEF